MKDRGKGFTLVEALFALALLSTVATALATTFAQVLRARSSSRDLVEATQLAAEAIERSRAGLPLTMPPSDRFQREVRSTAFSNQLERIEVTVTWNDGQRQELRLTTLLPR